MKGQKALPYIFLLVLFIIIVFILGVNYGKGVKQVNEAITFIMSITPSKSPLSTTNAPIQYKTYSNKLCGVQFLYPSILKTEGESSGSAIFVQNKQVMLQFSCEKEQDNKILKQLSDTPTASQEVTFQDKKIMGQKLGEDIFFSLRNPYKNRVVNLKINSNLLPLIDNTLQYTR